MTHCNNDIKTSHHDNDIDEKTICVIGAGINGLCVAKHLIANPRTKVTIFEATSRIGGLWVYEEDRAFPNALYKSLKSNIHQSMMHFPDFDFEAECLESHPHHSFVLKYIHYFAHSFDLLRHVKFNCKVTLVTPPDMNQLPLRWKVCYEHDVEGSGEDLFDAVVVCNGHFTAQYIPEIRGLDTTRIPWFHGRSYRTPDRAMFDGKLILIVGQGASGRDIGREIFGECANVRIYHVVHSKFAFGSKRNYYFKSFIRRFTEHSVQFDDGIVIFPDMAVLCTGYQHHFSFLEHPGFLEHPLIRKENGFECTGRAINGLYQHLVYPSLPTILFPGINHGVIPFLHAHFQAKWVAKILSDLQYDGYRWRSEYLPDYEHMLRWMKKHKQFAGARKQHFMPQQADYFRYICEQIGETYPMLN